MDPWFLGLNYWYQYVGSGRELDRVRLPAWRTVRKADSYRKEKINQEGRKDEKFLGWIP